MNSAFSFSSDGILLLIALWWLNCGGGIWIHHILQASFLTSQVLIVQLMWLPLALDLNSLQHLPGMDGTSSHQLTKIHWGADDSSLDV